MNIQQQDGFSTHLVNQVQYIEGLLGEAHSLRNREAGKSHRLAKRALNLSRSIDYLEGMGKSKNLIGLHYLNQNRFEEAFSVLKEVEELTEDAVSLRCAGDTNYYLGLYYLRNSQYSTAYEYFADSYQKRRAVNDSSGLAKCHFQLANVYLELGQLAAAENQAAQSLRFEEENGGFLGLAASLKVYGRIKLAQAEPSAALQYFQQSYEKYKEGGEKIGTASAIHHWIETQLMLGKVESCEEMMEEYLHLSEEQEMNFARCWREILLGKYYAARNEAEKAENAWLSAREIAAQEGLQHHEMEVYELLANWCEKHNQPRDSLNYFKRYIAIKEEMLATQADNRYKDSLDTEIEDIHPVFAKSFVQKNRKLIQKNQFISRIFGELQSSVLYAKRIQESLLPHEKQLQKHFPNSALWSQPKQIITGDFIWLMSTPNSVYFALADCTGHGVPGAMLSVYAHTVLKEISSADQDITPADLLNQTRERFIDHFITEELAIKDGMDAAIIRLQGNQLQFAGAYRPLFVFRKGELMEWKGDRQPVGMYPNMQPFHNISLQVEPGDKIVLFSDGVVDQVGGSNGKKIKSIGFKEWCKYALQKDPLSAVDELRERWQNWKGHEEQIDDVLLAVIQLD